jgi:hypothetical protein
VVLPDGRPTLEDAALAYLNTLADEQWSQLDQAFSDHILGPCGGLLRACMDTNDLARHLVTPLLNQAVTTLSAHLPITDVADAEFSAGDDLASRVLGYHALAKPVFSRPEVKQAQESGQRQAALVGVGSSAQVERAWEGQGKKRAGEPDQTSFLLIPASDAGKDFGEKAREVVAELTLVNVPGQADLTICREQANLGPAELERLLQQSRQAYREMSTVPQFSPHARFDISDWTPLDP